MSAPLRIISLGAGVQSTTVMLLAEAGELGRVDAAIFADTGWEPRAVYEHLTRLETATTIPVYRVTGGNIRKVYEFGKGGGLDLPFFLVNKRGDPGMARRQCTSRFKIVPIRRKVRNLMQACGAKRVEMLMGISFDEIQRMRDSDVKYITNAYPLVDRRWSRADCTKYLGIVGWDAPRSACIGCPFHSDAEWRRLRDDSPDEFADAIAFERECQEHGITIDATPFLHRQRVPLDQADLSTAKDRGQLDFDDECAGVCGV